MNYGYPVYNPVYSSRRYGGYGYGNPFSFGTPFYNPIPPYFFALPQARNSYYQQQQRRNQADSYQARQSQQQAAPKYSLTEADNFRISAGAILNTDTAKAAKQNMMAKLESDPFFSRISTRNNLQERLSAAMSEAFVLTGMTNGYGFPGNGVIDDDFQSFYKNLQLTLSRARDAGDGTKRSFGSISERLARKYFDRIKGTGNNTMDELNIASSSSVEMQRVSTLA